MIRSASLVLATIALLLGFAAFILAPDGPGFDPSRQRPKSNSLQQSFDRCYISSPITDIPVEMYRSILGADEILYKRLHGLKAFELYIARWKPGNPYAFEAADHPPDLCWPNVGWTMLKARNGVVLDSLLSPGHERVFSNGVNSQNVIFWCLANGRVINLPTRIAGTKKKRA